LFNNHKYKSADEVVDKLNKLLSLVFVVEYQYYQFFKCQKIGMFCIFFTLDLKSDVTVASHKEGIVYFSRVVDALEEGLLGVVVEVDYFFIEVEVQKAIDGHHNTDFLQLRPYFDVDVVLFQNEIAQIIEKFELQST